MGRFAKKDPNVVAQKQAANVMKQLQGSVLKSVATVANYEKRLTEIAKHVNKEFNLPLREITPDVAIQYLEQRSEQVGQKTLDMERQALQAMMQNVTKQLPQGETLTVIKSEKDQALRSRAYTPEQVKLIAQAQRTNNSLSTELAHAAGLRAHELLTLSRLDEQKASARPELDSKFKGREGVIYTVHGKGGLVRKVSIPVPLAERLERTRIDTPQRITDRGVHYTTKYQITGGQKWSNSFSAASKRALGWSEGAHGVRHSYAQQRMDELQRMGYGRQVALETVSQEMGHFRPDITEVYLR